MNIQQVKWVLSQWESPSQNTISHLESLGYKFICAKGGLGDNLIILKLIPEFLLTYQYLIIGTDYPQVFQSCGERVITCKRTKFRGMNVYKWMMDRKWNGNLVDAFRELYQINS